MQHGRGGLPAFRRLVGRPILQNVGLQDVVFAGGRGECIDARAAAYRAGVSKLAELTEDDKKQERCDLRALRTGLLMMVRHGAAPDLASQLPNEFGPPPLQNLTACPEGFGCVSCTTPSAPECALNTLTPPVPRCSLQNLSSAPTTRDVSTSCKMKSEWDEAVAEAGDDEWSEQTVAILGLLICNWEQAKEIQASKQPSRFKPGKLVKVLNKQWQPCGLSLTAGEHVQHVSNRFEFNGKSLLQLVDQYRSNTKARRRWIGRHKYHVHKYYDTLSNPYKPADHDTLLHEHWTRIRHACRPVPVCRAPPRRQTKQIALSAILVDKQTPKPEDGPFGSLDVKANMDRALDFAVQLICRCDTIHTPAYITH